MHHWVGAIYIPGVSVDDGFWRYCRITTGSRFTTRRTWNVQNWKSRDGEHFRAFFLRFRRHKVITVVLDTEHDIHYFRDAAGDGA